MTPSEIPAFNDDFTEAVAFATRLHASQMRKETDIPYISHLIGVAGLVLEHGGGRDAAIGALLHDSIEDQGQSYQGGPDALKAEIRQRFGETVLKIVEGCTDSETVPKPLWEERKRRYITHLAEVPEAVRLVSCADKLHNARAIVSDIRVMGDALFERFKGGKSGTLWYYRALADTFLKLGPMRLAQELVRTVEQMEQLAHVRSQSNK